MFQSFYYAVGHDTNGLQTILGSQRLTKWPNVDQGTNWPNKSRQWKETKTDFFLLSLKPWNWLPKELKMAASVDAFKRGLDALMKTERWGNLVQQL